MCYDKLNNHINIVKITPKYKLFHNVSASSFYVGPNLTTWNEANGFCKSNISQLVTIENKEEHISVMTWLSTRKKQYIR